MATSGQASALPDTRTYAPNFQVEVKGQELDLATHADVLEVKVVLDKDNLTSFELTVNNWDDSKFTFKHSDGPRFEPGNLVQVKLGYADRLVRMVTGQITTLTPRFPESGPPTLGVFGLDGMLRLRDRKPADSDRRLWRELADWQVAQQVAARNGLAFQEPRFKGEVRRQVSQGDLDDAQFLMELARRTDLDCFVTSPLDEARATLHFDRPTDGRDSQAGQRHLFEWGSSLIQFTPTLTTARQVSKVTVRGWDPRTKKPIVGTATKEDLPGTGKGGSSGPEVVEKLMGDKREVVVDAPVETKAEADARARSLLLKHAYDYVTGAGQCIGLPELRPGDNVELSGLGKRFSGDYYVKRVEHTLGGGGYLTQFEVRKIHAGGEVSQ